MPRRRLRPPSSETFPVGQRHRLDSFTLLRPTMGWRPALSEVGMPTFRAVFSAQPSGQRVVRGCMAQRGVQLLHWTHRCCIMCIGARASWARARVFKKWLLTSLGGPESAATGWHEAQSCRERLLLFPHTPWHACLHVGPCSRVCNAAALAISVPSACGLFLEAVYIMSSGRGG